MAKSDKSSKYEKKIIANTCYFELSAKEPDEVSSTFKDLLTKIMNSPKLQEKILMEN